MLQRTVEVLQHGVAPDVTALEKLITKRLATQGPHLRECLAKIYGAQPDFENWLNALLANVKLQAYQRTPDLVALDITRENNPDWHLDVNRVGYCTYVDRFAGNFSGLISRIGHLKSLGVRYLHLLPFLRAGSPPNDGGFAVASFDEVEPSLGNRADLQALIAALRSADIGLCCDFVLNHVSHEHPWAKLAQAGDVHYKNYFHVLPTQAEVHQWEQNLGQVFPGTAPGNFSYVASMKGWVWTTFYPYQWDLNYANPAVFSDISQALLNLANCGIESFRLDSTAFLWKRAGTNCMNQPQVHWLLQALRCIVNIVAPGVLLKAEAIVPTGQLPAYFGIGDAQGRECQIAYHASLMASSWYALATQDTQILAAVIDATPPLPAGTSWLTYVRCHDDIVWGVLKNELLTCNLDPQASLAAAARFFTGNTPGSFATGADFQVSGPGAAHGTNGMCASLAGLTRAQTPAQVDAAIDRISLLYALACFFGGMPVIYMGDELALESIELKPDDVAAGCDGRQIHRPTLPDFAIENLSHSQSVSARIYAAIQKILQLRATLPSLAADKSRVRLDTQCTQVLCLLRDKRVIGIFNFSEQVQNVNLPHMLTLAQSQGLCSTTDNAVLNRPATLKPWAYQWIVL